MKQIKLEAERKNTASLLWSILSGQFDNKISTRKLLVMVCRGGRVIRTVFVAQQTYIYSTYYDIFVLYNGMIW